MNHLDFDFIKRCARNGLLVSPPHALQCAKLYQRFFNIRQSEITSIELAVIDPNLGLTLELPKEPTILVTPNRKVVVNLSDFMATLIERNKTVFTLLLENIL